MTQELFVHSKDIDLQRGFNWDTANKKLWVDLHNLVDNDYIILNPTSGRYTVNPSKFSDLERSLRDLITNLVQQLNEALDLAKQDLKGKIDDVKKQAHEEIEKLKEKLLKEGNPVKLANGSGLKGDGTSTNPLSLDIKTGNGLKGDGTSSNPLTLKTNNDFIWLSDGTLALDSAPRLIDNLNNHTRLHKLGFIPMYGYVDNTNFTIGIPRNIDSTDAIQKQASSYSEVNAGSNYDWVGYQLGSTVEVIQVIQNAGIYWSRTNDRGMRQDGTLIDVNAWSDWKRETNTSPTPAEFNNLRQRVAQLESEVNGLKQKAQQLQDRLKSLEDKYNETCKIPIIHAGSHTIADGNNTIISTGGTITVPQGIPVGRLFTVIQSTDAGVSIVGSGVTVHPPLDGTLNLAGKNAVVTILISGLNEARVFGQTD